MESCESNEYAIVHKQKPPANRSAAHSVVCVPRRAAKTSHPSAKHLAIHAKSPLYALHLLCTSSIPSPYQRPTWAASCSGFALRRNPNMKRRR